MTKKRDTTVSTEEREKASRQVVQSYIATTAIYDFNVYEKRVLYNLVKIAQSQLDGVKIGTSLCRIEHTFPDFYKITLPITCFLIDGKDKNHARIKEALRSLHQKTFTYRDDSIWECFSIIANPVIQLRSSEVSFIVNSKVWDVLLNFSSGFTRYDLDVAFSLESSYSMRLYEMMASQDSPITYTIESLKRIFKVEDKYRFTKDFIRRVIEQAKKELDEKSPVTFTYNPEKDGNRITRITFTPVRQWSRSTPESFLKHTVRKYGIHTSLSDDEIRYLKEIGFTDSGIANNYPLFLDCKKAMKDFTYQLALIKGSCRSKINPCGWCIRTLEGKLKELQR